MRRAALATLALLLAGCVASAPTGDDGDAAEAPAAFALGACGVQEIILPVPPEQLAAFLPEGFAAEAFPAEGTSALIALVMGCEDPAPVVFGMVLVPVTTLPDAWRRADADAHAVVTSVVLEEGTQLRADLEAWGYGPMLATGSARMRDVLPSPADAAARAGSAEAATQEGARFVLDTAVRGTPRTDEGNFIRFFMAHERQVLGAWDGDLTGEHRVHSGEATMEARGYAPLPDGPSAGLGFHEFADLTTWTRVPAVPE